MIPGSPDQDLSGRQLLNQLSPPTQVPLILLIFSMPSVGEAGDVQVSKARPPLDGFAGECAQPRGRWGGVRWALGWSGGGQTQELWEGGGPRIGLEDGQSPRAGNPQVC